MITDVEHLSTCLLAICLSSLENIYSNPLPIFTWMVWLFLLLSCRNLICLSLLPFCESHFTLLILPFVDWYMEHLHFDVIRFVSFSFFLSIFFFFVIQLYLYFLSNLYHSSLICRIFSYWDCPIYLFFLLFLVLLVSKKFFLKTLWFYCEVGSIIVIVLQGKYWGLET